MTPPAPTVQPHSCPDGQFVCAAHGECVANHKVCDFRRDCSDGSDELSCGKTFISSQNLYKENLNYCIFFFLFSSLLPTSMFSFIFFQRRNNVISKVATLVVGWALIPLWSRPTHFAGRLTKGRAFMMESSTTVLSTTTPCEYLQTTCGHGKYTLTKPSQAMRPLMLVN